MAGYPQPIDRLRTASYDAASESWTWRDGLAQAAGSHPTFTLYPIGGHHIYNVVYDDATRWTWLLAQTRHGAPNVAPRVTITAPGGTTTSSVTIQATVTDADGVLDPVEFYAGSTRLGSDSSAPYQLVWNNVPAGTHWITVKATDNDHATSAAVLRATVQATSTPTPTILTPVVARTPALPGAGGRPLLPSPCRCCSSRAPSRSRRNRRPTPPGDRPPQWRWAVRLGVRQVFKTAPPPVPPVPASRR